MGEGFELSSAQSFVESRSHHRNGSSVQVIPGPPPDGGWSSGITRVSANAIIPGTPALDPWQCGSWSDDPDTGDVDDNAQGIAAALERWAATRGGNPGPNWPVGSPDYRYTSNRFLRHTITWSISATGSGAFEGWSTNHTFVVDQRFHYLNNTLVQTTWTLDGSAVYSWTMLESGGVLDDTQATNDLSSQGPQQEGPLAWMITNVLSAPGGPGMWDHDKHRIATLSSDGATLSTDLVWYPAEVTGHLDVTFTMGNNGSWTNDPGSGQIGTFVGGVGTADLITNWLLNTISLELGTSFSSPMLDNQDPPVELEFGVVTAGCDYGATISGPTPGPFTSGVGWGPGIGSIATASGGANGGFGLPATGDFGEVSTNYFSNNDMYKLKSLAVFAPGTWQSRYAAQQYPVISTAEPPPDTGVDAGLVGGLDPTWTYRDFTISSAMTITYGAQVGDLWIKQTV